jgi:xylose isomerase
VSVEENEMADAKSYHSICRWSFHAGKGGFTPSNVRPEWGPDRLDTVGIIEIIRDRVAPRLPGNVALGFEAHFDAEVSEKNAKEVADALVDAKMSLAFLTPGAHSHFGYGGPASLDAGERAAADDFFARTLDLGYGPLRKCWAGSPALAPTFGIWNGSFGYDLATVAVRQMYRNLLESVARVCRKEAELGAKMFIAIEPKPNEGHPAMLLPTVASAIVFWHRLEKAFGISLDRKGVNKEFGHSEMIGLDPVYDTVEEIECGMLVHMHVNSQGLSDGIVLGGPGKFDVDHGVQVSGVTVAIAGLAAAAKYARWKGHDMQPRPYDNVDQAVDRVVRSVISWEACAKAAAELDEKALMDALESRATAKAEDLMREAVVSAQKHFDRMYKG